MKEGQDIEEGEGWSDKRKESIDCDHPNGFSERAYCDGKEKNNESILSKRILVQYIQRCQLTLFHFSRHCLPDLLCMEKEQMVFEENTITVTRQ